jgi:hydroxyacylglutathione hydrolase
MRMSRLTIEAVPCLADNYAWLIADAATKLAAIVDPAEAAPVIRAVEAHGLTLNTILCTHHHHDHTGGNAELKQRTGAAIVGAAADVARIPGLDVGVDEKSTFEMFGRPVRILETPGHTSGAVCYVIEDAAFTGDTLFSLGCGRLFEGDAPTMLASLGKIAALSDDTKIYCGHEYTLANGRFALTVDGGNAGLKARIDEAKALRERGRPTLPSSVGLEKRTNPFLRCHAPDIRAALGMMAAGDTAVFAELRRRKDGF